ncbi:DUF2304 domain-containing protein [Boudabousia tangfeifanii]|nr:DUF2304 domain-containing protein [Boudabousia tangfeifanii]
MSLTGDQLAIKVVLIIGILIVAYFTLRSQGGERTLAIRRLALFSFLIFAVITVLWPSLLSYLAYFLGVGRGTDLVLYLLVIAFFTNLATSYRRTLATEARLTQLARQVAFNSLEIPDDAPAGNEAPFGLPKSDK